MKEISYEGPAHDKEETEWAKKKKPSIGSDKVHTMRTFRADVEELLEEKSETKTSIAMAEAARRESRGETRFPVEEEESHLGRIIFILVLVLAFGLGIGVYAVVGIKFSIPFLQSATSTEAVVTPNDTEIMITDSPREQILTDISLTFGKTVLPTHEERAIIFKIKNTDGTEKPASLENFLSAVGVLPPPKTFIESIDPEFAYHIYSGEALAGVLTLHSRAYANTFASMLEWEPEMISDLTLPLNPWYNRSTFKTLEGRVFHDERIGTVDARVLKDMLGNTVLLYGFMNKKTLIIAGTRDAFIGETTKIPVAP